MTPAEQKLQQDIVNAVSDYIKSEMNSNKPNQRISSDLIMILTRSLGTVIGCCVKRDKIEQAASMLSGLLLSHASVVAGDCDQLEAASATMEVLQKAMSKE